MRNANVKFKVKVSEIPENEKKQVATLLPKKVKFSKHAWEQMEKRNIHLNVNYLLKNVKIENVVDVQVENNGKVKFLIRFHYNPKKDIVVALAKSGVVCTVWTNWKNDTHKTLKDKHLYTNNVKELMEIVG